MAVGPGPLDGLDQRIRREAGQQLLEHDPHLEPGQVGAQAVVDAVAEGEVGVGAAPEVEADRVDEDLLVPVGRALPEQHLVPGPDRVARQVGGDRGGAPLGRRGRGPAQDLLDRRRQQAEVGPQGGQLVGVVDQRGEAAGDGVPGGVGAGREQEQKNDHSSTSVSWGGSSSASVAWTTVESMSSVGSARFAAMSARRTRAGTHGRGWAAGGALGIALPDVERGRHRLGQLVPVRLGHAEQPADGLHGQLGRHLDQEVERLARLDAVEQHAGAAPQVVLEPADRAGREPGGDEAADPAWRGSSIIVRTSPACSMSCRSVPPCGRSPPRSDE